MEGKVKVWEGRDEKGQERSKGAAGEGGRKRGRETIGVKSRGRGGPFTFLEGKPSTVGASSLFMLFSVIVVHHFRQESLADAKVSARQQCVYEDPYRRNLPQICN